MDQSGLLQALGTVTPFAVIGAAFYLGMRCQRVLGELQELRARVQALESRRIRSDSNQ
jgi:hypothetical protein